ncbi:hypothetical protein MIMGU_mgv1a002154mg [Erythranthe guttata]|uniref:Uncharacterized protein n=1 Tax=Erythranthe guttata TaxID=4155 RepID=A0A022QV97_ERYGU|nr:hypothetical protein MIMGU_mgv1a002154mg [Erythranthe guttata]
MHQGGLLLGPSFFGSIGGFTALVYPFPSLVVLDTLAVFGYMIYFFLIGVQMDPWIFKKIERKDISVGVSTVFLAVVLSLSGTFILLARDPSIESNIASSLPAVATSSSVLSFPIVAHYLTELKMVNSEFGRMALSSSLISNMFGFCIITPAILAKQNGSEIIASMQTFISGIGLKTYRGRADQASKAVGLNIFFGPLIYGITIPAGPPLGSALMEKLDLITSSLFMPLYFVKNGLVTDVFSVKPKNYLLVQSVILLACVGKFTGGMMSSIYNKVPLKEAVQIGLVMNVQGVLELGMFKMMKQNRAIQEEPFIVMCISMLIVTATITPLLRYLYDPLRHHTHRKRRTIMDMKPDSDLQIVVCVHTQENVPAIINLIGGLHPTKRSPIGICLIHLVELVGWAHPILIPHKLNKVSSRKATTSRSIVNAFTILQQSHHHGLITVHPFTAISPYETMHNEVCEMAFDRRASLIIIPFHRRLSSSRMFEPSEAGIKNMNDRVLRRAPCTVAIIVDRAPTVKSSRPETTESRPSLRVAVFFIGGPDDREALAIGARMACQSNISLTIVRLIPNNKVANEDVDETECDKDAVNELRSQMAGNMRVVYMEEVVKDGTGTVAVIRAMDELYEVIIVGKYHDTRSPLMLGLSDWGEGSELGPVGDMFVLADSSSHSTVLVVQQNNDFLTRQDTMSDIGSSVSTSIREGPTFPLRRSVV